MIRFFLQIINCAAFLLMASTASQAACREDFFTVQDYSFKDAGDEKLELAFTLQSTSPKAIRMIDAQFGFKDALGGTIGTMKLQRDVKITESGAYSETGPQAIKTFERLLTLDRNDITPFSCVRGVVYDDGTKEQF